MSEPLLDGPAIAKLFIDHSRVHPVLDREQAEECAKLCEIGKAYLLRKAKALVRNAEGRAVLFTYGSDATSAKCVVTYTAKVDAKRVQRRGAHGVELLVERAFLKTTTPSGRKHVACLWNDPRPLLQGKTAWVHVSAACKFFPLLRALGHTGIAVSHYCFDRALQSSLAKKMQQRHSLYYETVGGPSPRAGNFALEGLQDWVVNTACAAHDVHNSLMWGLRPFAADEVDVLRRLHVGIESLRNSFDLLHRFLRPFVAERLQFAEGVYNYNQVRQFWLVLSVEEEVADVLADLNLHWDGNALWVAGKHKDTRDLIEKVSSCILAVFRCKTFTSSRWLTIGCSCRSLIAAMTLGLSGLVTKIRKIKTTSDYYIHGFAQLDGAWSYAVVAAVASLLPDALLLDLLKDDRVAMRQTALEELVHSQLSHLAGIEALTWDRLADHLEGASAKSIRSDVFRAALTSAAFFQWRTLSTIKAYPWLLCSGDMDAKLQALADNEECPAKDATTRKIHQLLRIGWSKDKLKDGLQRMGEVHWTTLVQEQGHGSVALVHRVHNAYSVQMLTQRAFIHMTRGLFADPAGDKEARRLQQFEARIQAAESRQPQKISGRHVFMADCMEVLKTSSVAHEQRGEHGKNIMSRHAKVFRTLSAETQAEYESRASQLAEARRVSHMEKVVGLMAQKAGQASADKDKASLDKPDMTVASCKFEEADWLALAAMWNSSEFSRRKVASLREEYMQGHAAPSDGAVAQLEKMHVPGEPPLRPAAPWCKAVCWNRGDFANCAIVFETDGASQAFAFLFGMQNPLVAGFMPLEKVEVVLPAMPSTGVGAGLQNHVPSCQYKADWSTVVWNGDIETTDATMISVVRDLAHTSHGHCQSYWDPVPLKEYLGDSYAAAQERAQQQAEETPTSSAPPFDALTAYPWLVPFLKLDPSEAQGQATGSASSNAPSVPAFMLDDDQLEAVYNALAEQRQKCSVEAGEPMANFKTYIIGGAWTMANRGVAFDGIKAAPRHAEAGAWLRMYFPHVTASFAYGKYGDAVCNALALYWCQRMEYFYSIYTGQDDLTYAFTLDDVQSAPQPDKVLTDLGHNSDLEQACQARLATVIALVPVSL